MSSEAHARKRFWVDAPNLGGGHWMTTGEKIGEGGEAAVYAVSEHPQLALKHYHKIDPERAQKLRAMIAYPPRDPALESKFAHISIAWPVGIAYEGTQQRHALGFVMPLVTGMVRLHEVTYLKPRAKVRPGFTYQHLLRVAQNLAHAVHSIHKAGHVIGDLNDANVLVTGNAMITLVDTDSFQILDQSAGRTYRSPVGREEFTAPELHGRDFKLVTRDRRHDSFGLAVLVYQLLRDGQHPFAIHGASEELRTPGALIKAGAFPFAPRQTLYLPPRYALPFEVLDPALASAFVHAFAEGHANPEARPSAKDWLQVLTEAERRLRSCTDEPERHWYPGHLAKCPWCALDKARARKHAAEVAPISPLAPRLPSIGGTPVAAQAQSRPNVAAQLDPGVAAAGANAPSLFQVSPALAATSPEQRDRRVATIARVAHRFTDSAGEEVRVSLLYLERAAHLDVRTYPRDDTGVPQAGLTGLTLPMNFLSKLSWAVEAATIEPRSITLEFGRVLRVGAERYQGAPVLDIRMFVGKRRTDNAFTIWEPLVPELLKGLELLT